MPPEINSLKFFVEISVMEGDWTTKTGLSKEEFIKLTRKYKRVA
jgi:hypothetical protein